MADDNKNTDEEIEERLKDKRKAAVEGYEKLIHRLKKERANLEDELNRDYREARRYVRSHPEEGILVSFVGGVALGYILGKIGGK